MNDKNKTDAQPCPAFNSTRLYNRWNVRIRFRNRLVAGIPGTAELIESWMKARIKFDDALRQALIDKNKELLAKSHEEAAKHAEEIVEEQQEKTTNVFLRDEHGLYIETRQIKSMFKECGSLLDMYREHRGSKDQIQHGTFLIKGLGPNPDYNTYLGTMVPDGVEERPIHIKSGPMGPRNAIKRVEWVDHCEIEFEIWALRIPPAATRAVTEQMLTDMLTLAQENGLGADRSQGQGMFHVLEPGLVRISYAEPKEPEEDGPKPKKGKAPAKPDPIAMHGPND